MANKRMFTMKIVDSDAFLDMPLSTQCLYFHLNMRADDDGFVGNPKKIVRIINASQDDLKLLIAKRFVLTFENGVIVIKHWRMHNTLSTNRYNETQYLEEKSMLLLKENGSYSFTNGSPLNDKKLIEKSARQSRRTIDATKTHSDIDKDIDKDIDIELDLNKELNKDIDSNKNKDSVGAKTKRFCKPTLEEVKDYINENNLNVNAQYWYDFYESNGWKVGRNPMKDWKACVRRWNKTEMNDLKSNRNKSDDQQLKITAFDVEE